MSSELLAEKKAHTIVLDTKDAVVRSLIKQNTELARQVCEPVAGVQEKMNILLFIESICLALMTQELMNAISRYC